MRTVARQRVVLVLASAAGAAVSSGAGSCSAPLAPAGAVQAAVQGGLARYDHDPVALPRLVDGRAVVRAGDQLRVGDLVERLDALGRVVRIGDVGIAYGPDGQPAAAASDAGVHVRYLSDEHGERLARLADDGSFEIYGEGGARLDADGVSEPLRLDGRVVGLLHEGVFQAVPVDRRGSRLDAAAGGLAPTLPHGERREAARGDLLAFAGAARDPLTGLVRLGVRDYDPRSARFTSADPLLLERPELCRERASECNLYGYARGNPVDVVDPSGQAGQDDSFSEGAHHTQDLGHGIQVKGPGYSLDLAQDLEHGPGVGLSAEAYVYKIAPEHPYYLAGDAQHMNLSLEPSHTGPSATGIAFAGPKAVGVGFELSALKGELKLEGCHFLCVSVTGSVGLGVSGKLGYFDGKLKAGFHAAVLGLELGVGLQKDPASPFAAPGLPSPWLPGYQPQRTDFEIVGLEHLEKNP